MYTPAAFEMRPGSNVVRALRGAGFGHLASHGQAPDEGSGLVATASPFVVDDDVPRVRAHFAKANPHWRQINGRQALLIVPTVGTHVSPRWYPSKSEHVKVVQTSNYEVFHLHGVVEIRHDTDIQMRHTRQFASVDPKALEDRWSPNALCGVAWFAMAREHVDEIGISVLRPEAPTCKRCMAVVDRSFPNPTPDDRIALIADLIDGAVAEQGSGEVVGVPGDQIAGLRGAARRRIKKRFGFSARTWAHEDLLVVSSPDTQHIVEQNAGEIVPGLKFDEASNEPVDSSGWRFRRDTWSVQ